MSEKTTEMLVAERGQTYGLYSETSRISQNIKNTFKETPGYVRLKDFQREALDFIANKIARALNGKPDYVDNWDDIAGYAKLVSNELQGIKV